MGAKIAHYQKSLISWILLPCFNVRLLVPITGSINPTHHNIILTQDIQHYFPTLHYKMSQLTVVLPGRVQLLSNALSTPWLNLG